MLGEPLQGYWKELLHLESQPLLAFIMSDEDVQSTHTTEGGCNYVANFQKKAEEFFHELRSNLNAWIYDFMIFAKGKKTTKNTKTLLRNMAHETSHCVVAQIGLLPHGSHLVWKTHQ